MDPETTRDAAGSGEGQGRGAPSDEDEDQASRPCRVALIEVVRGAIDAPLGWLAFGLFWFFSAVFAREGLLPRPMQTMPDWVMWIPLLLAPLVGRLSFFRRRRGAEASVGPEGLRLSTRTWKKILPRKEITSACFRPGLPGTEVELRLTDRSVLRLHIPDYFDAATLLRAVGRDTAHRPARIGIDTESRYKRAGYVALAHVVVMLAVSFLGGMGSWPVFRTVPGVLSAMAAQALISFALVRLTRSTEVTVGLDAVIVHRPFRDRVIPWSRIEEIGRTATDLTLTLAPARAGAAPETVRIRTNTDPVSGQALYDRLIEAQALRDRTEDGTLGRRVARGGRSFEEWRTELIRLLSRAGEGYRSAAVSVEALRALAANPSAPAEHRLGAAMALGVAGDPDGKAAVRISARSVVSPKLRIALREAVQATPDAAAIEEALSEAAEAETAGEGRGQSG